VWETDLPAGRLLRDAEQFAAAARERQSSIVNKSGEFLLAVPRGSSVVPVRVLVPKPAPTVAVIALHGAGGSESMFFEAYGDGMIVRLCRERGWMLIAPKLGTPLDDVWATVDAIESAFGVNFTRRFVVGHSLGAVTALGIGQRRPERVAGLAAISGGSFGSLEPLRNTPVFVAAGTEDFGKAGSTSVVKRLEELGAPVQFKLYACEHMLIVPESLPDIFHWFEMIESGKGGWR
jgi:predicted esterase